MSEPFVPGDSNYNILKKILQNQAGPYPFVNGDSDYNILRKILMNQYHAEFVIPEASTTQEGVVRLATNSEARDGLLDTVALTPEDLRFSLLSGAVRQVPTGDGRWSNSASGGGVFSLSGSGDQIRVRSSATGGGNVIAYRTITQSNFGIAKDRVTFAVPFWLGIRMSREGGSPNGVLRVLVGKIFTPSVGALASMGLGLEFRNSGTELWVVAHNGTTLTEQQVTYTQPAAGSCIELQVMSLPNGSVYVIDNTGGIIHTVSSGGPTGLTAANVCMTIEATNGGDSAENILDVGRIWTWST